MDLPFIVFFVAFFIILILKWKCIIIFAHFNTLILVKSLQNVAKIIDYNNFIFFSIPKKKDILSLVMLIYC